MYRTIPLDFRSRNMHNKNNKIDQYNKQFMSLGYLGTGNHEEISRSGSNPLKGLKDSPLITAKAHSNNVKLVDQDYRIPIKKQLGDNLYNMMLNDERDITSGCDNLYVNTNIFNNYIQNNRIDYKNPDNLFADYSNKSSKPKNIYNTLINNTYNINNVTDIQNSATVHSSPIIKPVIITVSNEYIFKSHEYSKYVDSSFINKVF